MRQESVQLVVEVGRRESCFPGESGSVSVGRAGAAGGYGK